MTSLTFYSHLDITHISSFGIDGRGFSANVPFKEKSQLV